MWPHLAKKERQWKAADIGTHRKERVGAVISGYRVLMVLGGRGTEDGRRPRSQVNSGWTGEAVSWVGGKTKEKTQGRSGTFPRTPGDFLTLLSRSLLSMLLSCPPPWTALFGSPPPVWIRRATLGPAEGQCVDT